MNDIIVLENENIHLEVNKQNGSIQSIFLKDISQELLAESKLADSFKINVQSETLESSYICGSKQKLTSYEENHDTLRLFWQAPLINENASYNISVKMDIKLTDNDATFSLQAENKTDCRLSEVWTPILGGIKGLGKREDTKVMIPVAGESAGEDMFTHFKCHIELGIPIPEMVYSYPGQMGVQWCDIYNPIINRGIYLACHDREPRYKSIRFELEPGAAHIREDNWPREDEFDSNIPIGLNTNWVFYPYTAPNDTFTSPPLVLKYHSGSWENAAAYYRDWFHNSFPMIHPNGGQRNEMSFLSSMFMLPEGNILFRYADIPTWVDSAKKRDINAVLICGWQMGGHDNGYPYYDPDPRLGTLEELKAGIEYAHLVGVKIYFFVNFNQMDTYTPIYKDTFEPYTITDQWGNASPYGFGMGTLAARLNYSSRKLVNIDPSYEPMREYIIDKLKWLAEIGADGFHIDKIGFSNVSAIDLNKRISDLGYSPDSSIWSGILAFCKELSETCQKINPDFCFSVEGSWDRFLEFTDVMWMWHDPWADDHTCAVKHTFSQWTPNYTITQPNDYTSVNEAVRHGYQLLISPMMFTASTDNPKFDKLGRYIAETNRIRSLTRSVIYDGKYLEPQYFSVSALSSHIKYKAFVNTTIGKRGCVITNTDKISQEVSMNFSEKDSGKLTLHIPFEKEQIIKMNEKFILPSESFAVVIDSNE